MASDDWVIRVARARQESSREQDVTSIRVQLQGGLAQAIAEKGYAATSVADIAERAGVTEQDFHQQYPDIESCFLAAYDLGNEVLMATIQDALCPADLPPLTRMDRLLKSYLELLAAEPAFARTFLIEVYAAGPRAMQRRKEVYDRFATLFAEVLAPANVPGSTIDPFVCEALVGAIGSLVTARVGAGEFKRLPDLREPLMDFIRRVAEPVPPVEPAATL
jgi:AcrR family transcriptional regulator